MTGARVLGVVLALVVLGACVVVATVTATLAGGIIDTATAVVEIVSKGNW